MVTFRNNNSSLRRNNFRRNDRNFKTNGDRPKFGSNFSNNDNFKRGVPGRNNHNASKLIEKYNDLAREATSSGDKILSENYLQHADHFTRVWGEQENIRKARFTEKEVSNLKIPSEEVSNKSDDTISKDDDIISKDKVDEIKDVSAVKKTSKTQVKVS